MKYITLLITLFAVQTMFAQESAWTNKRRVLPDALRKVPEAIFIKHTPNPNYPEASTPADKTKSAYIWKHSTSVLSPDMELEVVKAGSFIWYDETGWKENVQLTNKDFAKRFKCPKGLLKAGTEYTFVKNYRYGNNLYGGDALWYVIAKDKNGKLYKGMSILETESELLEK